MGGQGCQLRAVLSRWLGWRVRKAASSIIPTDESRVIPVTRLLESDGMSWLLYVR